MAEAFKNVTPSQGDYELIDVDPHFSRVVRYFRGSDYLRWALFTGSAPLFLYLSEHIQSEGKSRAVNNRAIRVATFVGFFSGFIFSYNRSSKRFQGVVENQREVEKDRYEIKSLLAQGKKPYGETDLPPWIQRIAAKNSTYSSTFNHIFPWFNLVHHEYHGIDLRKYYEVREGEEKWGFNLEWPEKQE
ncbi:NUXM subunit of mitochondrial NADH:ubiquinone oxidoreductase (complex I), putative [Geotrichum candidum]|uniref:NUXM subunit of mitochondrial NADH:ubiquinone oxidoreductase (Complex I), putative n=1 Tax=Geotrichum candidum TaxID=1173061 RepID=A0A0J9XDE4_GEOCN|nr:NUXM subunit of mitochondrial NADH:ubiquinone oxidoreductase (complex I), putative [Geotrichum candidum]